MTCFGDLKRVSTQTKCDHGCFPLKPIGETYVITKLNQDYASEHVIYNALGVLLLKYQPGRAA
jgi:hypothetical protein